MTLTTPPVTPPANAALDNAPLQPPPARFLDVESPPRPKIVVLCGSSRFVDVMAVCAWLIERDEQAITMGRHLLPAWYPNVPAHHLAEHEGVAAAMDALHLRKIDLADEIFVVDVGGYIGASTATAIAYASIYPPKPIRYFTVDPVGASVEQMALVHARNFIGRRAAAGDRAAREAELRRQAEFAGRPESMD